jgi:predicted ribosomally synthesized peptide with SipW-like signal peptide
MSDALRRDRRHNQGRRRCAVRSNGRRILNRKVTAVLAGGLVLGIGAASTLAAWTDQEQTQATFTAGIFRLMSSTNGSTFEDHTSNVATLTFTGGMMSPGSLHNAFLDVKTTGTSTLGGTVKFMPKKFDAAPAEMEDYLTVRVTALKTPLNGQLPDCEWSTSVGAEHGAINEAPISLVDQSLSSSGGNVIRYCVQTAMSAEAPSSLQGASATVTWTVTGTSDS